MTVPDHIVFDAEPLIAHADDEPGTSCILNRGPRTRVRGCPYVQYRGDPCEEASEPISADAGSGLHDVYRLLEQESFDNAEIVTALREKIRAHGVNCRGVTFKPRDFTVSRTLFNSSPCAIRVASPQLFGYRFPVSIVCRGEVFSNQ
jgi:hypothetical protein